MNIGVLDDNPAILDLLATTLRLDGHTVYTHMTGESMLNVFHVPALSISEPPPYDLVILDLLLPGGQTGADVFLSIRKNFPSWQLPVIIVTAVSGPTLEQFRQILPDDVPLVRKPFSPRALRELIHYLVHQ
jgi:two-component system OmpR family response regulator